MKVPLALGILLIAAVALLAWGLQIGSLETDLATIRQVLLAYDSSNPVHYAILHLRIPRMLLAFLTGAALSFSGYLMQALVNNPLADPFLLGTAPGAALGANLAALGIVPTVMAGVYMPPVLAFVGATLVTLLVISFSYQRGQIIPSQLLLGGVALSSLLTAFSTFLTFLSRSESELRSVVFWSLGGFERAQWDDLPALTIILLFVTVLFTFLHKQLTILLLGESRAVHLGVALQGLRWTVLFCAALATSVAVSQSGVIGFVGLVIPHVIRAIFGVSEKYNVTLTVLAGGVFILGCDLVSRVLLPPAGLPVGILTSFLGVPFFLYLIRWKKYRFS